MLCLSWSEIRTQSGAGLSRSMHRLSHKIRERKEEDRSPVLWGMSCKKIAKREQKSLAVPGRQLAAGRGVLGGTQKPGGPKSLARGARSCKKSTTKARRHQEEKRIHIKMSFVSRTFPTFHCASAPLRLKLLCNIEARWLNSSTPPASAAPTRVAPSDRRCDPPPGGLRVGWSDPRRAGWARTDRCAGWPPGPPSV